MRRKILNFGLVFALSLIVATFARPQNVAARVVDFPNLPIRLKDAIFKNLEDRADFNYTVENRTDNGIWNYEIALFFQAPNGAIERKIDICVDFVIKDKWERCRYFPPGVSVVSRETEVNGVILNERVEAGTRTFVAIKEVRGENGIWQIDDADLRNAVKSFARGESLQPPIKVVKHIVLSNADKQAAIKSALELALIKKQIPDYGLIKDKQNVVLSSKNVPTNADLNLSGVNILLLSPDKIQEKADREGDFTFLSFGEITANGDKMFVVITNTWVKSRTSKMLYLSGGGMFLEYQKKDGKWVGNNVGGWIS